MLRLAREIAMDIHPLEKILEAQKVSTDQWDWIRQNPRFQLLLSSCTEAWNSATNAAERVRVKSLFFIEEALPEFFARVHDKRENLSAKTEVLKAVSKLAGLGQSEGAGVGADRFSVTINLGGNKTLNITKDVTPVGNTPLGALEGPVIDIQTVNQELG
jgi:hypothetical protein